MDQNSIAMLGHAQGINSNLGALVQAFKTGFPLSAYIGTFTMAAAASKSVTDTHAKSTSMIMVMPTNAAAGTLMGSAKSLYITKAVGSFTVTTASGAAAAGTETFDYIIVNTAS